MSTVPDAIDGLILVAERALPTVQVIDGQPVADMQSDFVTVGYSPNRLAAEGALSTDGISRGDRESYDIACLVSSWSGSQPVKPVRDRAWEMFEAFRSELAKDRNLGGTVTSARCRAIAYEQVQTPEGPMGTVEFVIHIDAFG